MVKNDIPVQISCPTMKLNREGYKDVLIWANGLKMKAQTDFIMMGKTDGTTDNLKQRLDNDELKLLIKDIIDFDKDYHGMIDKVNPPSIDLEKYKEESLCGVGIDTICMTSDGNFYPCAGWQDYPVGNIKESSIKNIWETSERLIYLRGLKRKVFTKCLSCNDKDFCAMCLVRNFNEGGDMLKINEHFCDAAKVNKEVVEDYFEKNKIEFVKKKSK